jgi:hypothetical protein
MALLFEMSLLRLSPLKSYHTKCSTPFDYNLHYIRKVNFSIILSANPRPSISLFSGDILAKSACTAVLS